MGIYYRFSRHKFQKIGKRYLNDLKKLDEFNAKLSRISLESTNFQNFFPRKSSRAEFSLYLKKMKILQKGIAIERKYDIDSSSLDTIH